MNEEEGYKLKRSVSRRHSICVMVSWTSDDQQRWLLSSACSTLPYSWVSCFQSL